jgi:hypothetical protein
VHFRLQMVLKHPVSMEEHVAWFASEGPLVSVQIHVLR